MAFERICNKFPQDCGRIREILKDSIEFVPISQKWPVRLVKLNLMARIGRIELHQPIFSSFKNY